MPIAEASIEGVADWASLGLRMLVLIIPGEGHSSKRRSLLVRLDDGG